jgi:DNA repair protein RecO (recombination protein O)
MKQTDIGIFLHRTSFSESSLITTFYTQNNGLQKFVFQGAKKKNNNFFPLNICELTYYRRPDSELGKLTASETINPFNSIVSNPIKSVIAFFIVDVVRQSLQTNEKEPEVFLFLSDTISELNKSNELTLFPLRFLANFTYQIGIQPSISEYTPLYFNLTEGEFHSDYRSGEWCEEGEIVMDLYALFNKEDIPISSKKQVLEILLKYYSIHIPRFDVGKSLEIIREVLM